MLVQLVVKNLGLIEAAELNLGSGLQVITGETGVGKSMLLSSLGILRGDRARSDLIRRGEKEAWVSGFFVLESPGLRTRVAEICGEELPDGELLIERRLRSSGRHQTRLNGREVPLSLLQKIGSQILEIHGQRSQLDLLDAQLQLEYLDRYAGTHEARREFGVVFEQLTALSRRIDDLSQSTRERNDRRLFLDHVLAELEAAQLRPAERAELERELGLLEDRDRIVTLIQESVEEIYEGERSMLDRLADKERSLGDLGELHPGLAEFATSCETARAALEEAVRSLRAVEEDLDSDPARLDAARQRHHQLLELEERYHRSGDELGAYLEEVRAEHGQLVDADHDLPALESELRAGLDALGKQARSLARKRRTAAKRLSAAVSQELRDLQMPDARFEVTLDRLKKHQGWHGFQASGGDRLEFEFGPNPGEPLHPLRETASGGELSRVMLSLKKALADSDSVPVIVFDEIDAGVGGRLGTELGRKLKQIGANHQVLCVTHLPQIASFGSSHFRVTKEVSDGRTHTQMESLDSDRRVEEIAAMIRGEGRTETSLAEARAMIAEGQ